MKPKNMHVTEECRAISDVLARVGDKWSILVVSKLGRKTMRFNELRRDIGNISQRMLTLTLRGLERDGLITRTVYASVPPRVDYQLTPLGCSLLRPVNALSDWALANKAKLADARERFDSEAKSAARAGKPSLIRPVGIESRR